ncbi:MAG TPA: tetraacyldisaccharide 4'-kinase, partial [Chromatiales bacterium]|nr:tetraacyldisaccharide 4'-kinase [Chromatiales bacterium]
WLYRGVITVRRKAYQLGLLQCVRLPVPVVVVGNITVGGTGKTPLVLWIAQKIVERGYRPGIVSRGYGGRGQRRPRLVTRQDRVSGVGDEALLLARHAGCPVCVGSDRVQAAQLLLEQGVELIISDDGLQHYRLARDLEIAVLDAGRQVGNGRLLPAGPLREPVQRLAKVDLVLVNGQDCGSGQLAFVLRPDALVNLSGAQVAGLSDFGGRDVWAVAGIGNPDRFFTLLRDNGIHVHPVAVADHGFVDLERLTEREDWPILMTEKDAVKYAGSNTEAWYLPVQAELCPQTETQLVQSLGRLLDRASRPGME